MALFREGLERLQAGQDQEARALWRKAVDIDPKNLVVRK
jgi:Tfp pilus assembly protein PilF